MIFMELTENIYIYNIYVVLDLHVNTLVYPQGGNVPVKVLLHPLPCRQSKGD